MKKYLLAFHKDIKKMSKRRYKKLLLKQLDTYEWSEFQTVAFAKMVEGDEEYGNWQKRFKKEKQLDSEIDEELFDIMNYLIMRNKLREKL